MTEISKVDSAGTSRRDRGVPAAAWSDSEKPLCKCHSTPMRWQMDATCKAGGRWACRIRHSEDTRRRRLENPEKLRAQARRQYAKNLEQKRAQARDARYRWYHNPAKAHQVLSKLMRDQLRYHAQRLNELEERLGA